MARKKGRGTDYDSFYYGRCLNLNQTEAYRRDERWLNFFGTIADRIVRDFGPQTVLDAGCAMGFLVEALRDRGVEAYGIDISEYALAQVREDIRPYCRKASVTAALKRKYDLIVCIETLEHLPKRDAEHAVQNFCAHTGDVLFSSTPHDYKEATHVNVMPRDYWAELFARLGFVHDLDYDPSTYLSPWAVRFRKSQEGLPRVAATYERVLARYQDENVALRELDLWTQKAASPSGITGQDPHRVPVPDQERDQLRPQVAGAAGYEDHLVRCSRTAWSTPSPPRSTGSR